MNADQVTLEFIILGIQSLGSLVETFLINGFKAVPALNTSPSQVASITLFVGNDIGQLWKVLNADNPNGQTRVNFNRDEFVGRNRYRVW